MTGKTSSLADDITISIVSHGHGPLLVRLLGDLDRQRDLNRVKVVLTLNIPEAVDISAFQGLHIEVIRNVTPRGFGANHNQAFALCSTRWFLVLNPDLNIDSPNTFSRLAMSGSYIDKLGVIAPRVESSDGATEDAVRSNLTPLSLVRRRFGDPGVVTPNTPSVAGKQFYWLAGMCMMINTAAFTAVGGFDKRFFLYCEDYDLCARLYIAGYALAVDQNVSVVHDAQRDSHRSGRHLRWHLASLLRIWTSAAFWRVTLKAPRP